jgi:hypothetical protein
MRNSALLLFSLLILPVFSGCSKSGHDHAGHGGHVHKAPHGGTLVELGDHAYNLELVRDAAEGKLTVYVLDGHAEEFIRIATPSFELIATAGGEKKPLTLRAVANPTTGETVGNTSQFEAQADWLKTTAEFSGAIPSLDVKGTQFANVTIAFSRAKP